MPTMQYQRDGSIIVTNDAGDVIVVPAGTQTDQDAAIQAHNGPEVPPEPTLEDKVNKIAALLVGKNVATEKEMKDATAIDTAALAVEIKPGP